MACSLLYLAFFTGHHVRDTCINFAAGTRAKAFSGSYSRPLLVLSDCAPRRPAGPTQQGKKGRRASWGQ